MAYWLVASPSFNLFPECESEARKTCKLANTGATRDAMPVIPRYSCLTRYIHRQRSAVFCCQIDLLDLWRYFARKLPQSAALMVVTA